MYTIKGHAEQLSFISPGETRFESSGHRMFVAFLFRGLFHRRSLHNQVSGVDLNLSQMLKAKDTSVTSLTKGIEGLFKKNKVDYIKGTASFESPSRLSVNLLDGNGQMEVEGKNIIIATGSEVTPFPGIEIDEEHIVSSTGALSLKHVPGKMAVIGGGIIGLEMSSVWSRLGSEVTVIEFLPYIGGAGLDEESGYVLSSSFLIIV